MTPAPALAHDEILAGTDLARIHRFSLLVAIAWGFFTISHFVAGRMLLANLHGAAFVVSSAGVAIAFSRIPWRDRVSLPLVAGGSLLALVSIAVITGGSDAPAMGFVALVPLVTGLHRRRTERLVWLVVSIAAIGSIPVLQLWIPSSAELEVSLMHRVVAAVGLAVLLYAWGTEWRASSDAQAHTIRAQAEEIRNARDEALRASEQKSRFVAMTSHELRGPLNGILGMSHALEDTRLEAHQRELVRALSISAESLSHLLADLLDVARIEHGKLDVVLAPTEIREVLADVVDAYAPAAAQKGIELAALAHERVPQLVQADAGRLAQVLRNLVSNAVKFTDRGAVVLEASRASDMLVLSVTDSGKGMRAEDIGRIFAPFEQVSADLVDRRAGTGLGLWIARNLVERWGGAIDVSSTPDRGTTFRVTLPLQSELGSQRSSGTFAGAFFVAVTRGPLTARAFESVARELSVKIDVRPSYDPGREIRHDARAVIADVESLAAPEIRELTQLGLGARLVLAGQAHRIAECERLAAACGARVLLLPVRASRLAPVLDRGRVSIPARALHGTLLVVDDDAINRRVARHAAEQLGLEVLEAATGDAAIELLRGAHVDVVLLDLHLEGTTGDVVAARIRDEVAGEPPALLAYTGTVNDADRRRLKDAGMADILGKPLDRSAFAAAIGRVLHARRRRSRAPAASSAFEVRALGELAAIMGDAATARTMLAEFIPQMQSRVDAIDTAAQTGDLALVGAESHKLASMAATFGAIKLASLARGLEIASQNEGVEHVKTLGAALVVAQSETAPLLRAYLADQ
jgi:signal transduction histidine kinase/CheY-like chemotaxis protein/HPt (histidine-containing phosphotransfer) domain-containing protein